MTPWNMTAVITFAMAVVLGVSGAIAQQPSAAQQMIDGIIHDVIDRAADTAHQEVRRNTGIDPLQRGYDPSKNYEPVPSHASEKTRRELQKLSEEHDRKITKIEEELHKKLTKARDEFQREAAKEHKPEKIEKKRGKLQDKVAKAYAQFEKKIAEENRRFDEKRRKILSKA